MSANHPKAAVSVNWARMSASDPKRTLGSMRQLLPTSANLRNRLGPKWLHSAPPPPDWWLIMVIIRVLLGLGAVFVEPQRHKRGYSYD
jgi:hypothetical protein